MPTNERDLTELPEGCFPITGREHLVSLFIHLPAMGKHERACAIASIIAHIGLQAQCLTAQAECIAQLDADLEDIRHSEAMVRKESSDRAERIAELEELNSHLRMAVTDRAAVIKLMRDRAEAAEAAFAEAQQDERNAKLHTLDLEKIDRLLTEHLKAAEAGVRGLEEVLRYISRIGTRAGTKHEEWTLADIAQAALAGRKEG